MNWFERYGIVGMFFIVMTLMWFFCLFPDSFELFTQMQNNEAVAKYIVGFCGLGFLPIGYVVMIFSQALRYWRNSDKEIHRQYWSNLLKDIKTRIQSKEKEKMLKEISEKDQKNEAKIEAILTYYDRKYITSVEINKFMSKFATKRYDVIAINEGLIISTVLSLIFAVCLKLITMRISLKELLGLFSLVNFSTWFAIIASIGIIVILWYSSKILKEQIMEIGNRKLTDIMIDEQSKEPKPRPNG